MVTLVVLVFGRPFDIPVMYCIYKYKHSTTSCVLPARSPGPIEYLWSVSGDDADHRCAGQDCRPRHLWQAWSGICRCDPAAWMPPRMLQVRARIRTEGSRRPARNVTRGESRDILTASRQQGPVIGEIVGLSSILAERRQCRLRAPVMRDRSPTLVTERGSHPSVAEQRKKLRSRFPTMVRQTRRRDAETTIPALLAGMLVMRQYHI